MKWQDLLALMARKIFPNSSRGILSRLEAGHRTGVDLYADGLYPESEERFRKNLTLARSLGAESPPLLDYLTRLGDFYYSTGNYSSAEQPLLEALEISRQRFGAKDHQVAPALNDVALLYYAQGRYRDARKGFEELAEILHKHAPDSIEMAICLENLAAALRRLDGEEESNRLRARAREIRQSL